MSLDVDESGGTHAPAASLIEISRVLEETARIVRQHAGTTPLPKGDGGSAPIDAGTVRRIAAARRMRADFLGVPPSDHAWAMLLELYAALLEGRRMSQTMLAIAAGVPETTAIRVARKLVAKGVFTSSPDIADKRLLLIGLSDSAAERMRAYLTAVLAGAGFVP